MKLPKGENKTPLVQPMLLLPLVWLGAGVMLRRRIGLELSRSLVSPWTPPFCKTKRVAWSGPQGDWWLEGAESVRAYHASDLQAPKGTGDLTVRIPKGRQSGPNGCILIMLSLSLVI